MPVTYTLTPSGDVLNPEGKLIGNVAATRTASEAILSVLRRGSKKGLTASTIAERAKLNPNTVRTSLYSLTGEGKVVVVGRETLGVGRPAHLYALAT